MMFVHQILAFFFLVGICLCNPISAKRPMQVYKDECGDSGNSPTWQAMSTGKEVNYEAALLVAHQHYNWVKDQPNFCTSTGTCLVAVFAEPTSRKFYASTIARGLKNDLMRETGAQAAPVWYNQVKDGRISGARSTFDAEDGAYFNWESSQHGQTQGGHYPEGSVVAVWGKYPGNPIEGKQVMPCQNKNPSCQTVAQNLGVKFTPN